MSVVEIPKSYRYTCDSCDAEHLQENASGPYTHSTPPHWARLILKRLAYEGDIAVGDGTSNRLICSTCTSIISAAVEAAILERRR